MRSESADKYRKEAARIREEAEHARAPNVRRQLLDIAAQYDRLAEMTESLSH